MKLVSQIEHSIQRRFILNEKEVLVIKDFIPGKPVLFEQGPVENWAGNLLQTYPHKYHIVDEGEVLKAPVGGLVEGEKPPTQEELEAKTVPELRVIADAMEIEKTVKLKADLIQAILAKLTS